MSADQRQGDDTNVVHIPVEDVLDLHTFLPKEVPQLLEDYLESCLDAGIFCVRVIHGKGTGTLRTLVHKILDRSPLVQVYRYAPEGNWGVTVVELRSKSKDE